MFPKLSKVLSPADIDTLATEIIEDARSGSDDAVARKVQRLRGVQRHQVEAARALLRVVTAECLATEVALDVLAEVEASHGDDAKMLGAIGELLEVVRDIDDLNAPPPEQALFQSVVARLEALAGNVRGRPEEERVVRGLATAARMMGRQCDGVAERSYRRLTEIDLENSTHHYNLGLFFKTHGRFEEGMTANQTAARLSDEAGEACEWNLGICATGARRGDVALDVWKRMGQIIEMGRFGLPDGGYPQCKVKLAERPLAERSASNDDPGLEETIWIERLSPCHGIIRSVLFQDLGVDFGDVILFDGAPITYHTYGDVQISVFPHLATLVRRGYRMFDFAGTQEEARQLADASGDLDGDCIVYSHSENYRNLCASCWRDPDLDHEHRESVEKHVVVGRIAAPPEVDPGRLLDQIDAAVEKRSPCRLYAPDLCMAAGSDARASVARRRYELLAGN